MVEVRNKSHGPPLIGTYRKIIVRKRPAINSVCRLLRDEVSSHLRCAQLILKGCASQWILPAHVFLTNVQNVVINTTGPPDDSIPAILAETASLRVVAFSGKAPHAFAPELNRALIRQTGRLRRSMSDDATIPDYIWRCLVVSRSRPVLDSLLMDGARPYAIVLDVRVWSRTPECRKQRINAVVDIDHGVVLQKRPWDVQEMECKAWDGDLTPWGD